MTAMPSATASASPQLASPTVSPTATATVAATLGHGEFGPTGAMAVARNGQTATLLLDGRVLIAGGSGNNTAELFSPQTGTFSPTGPINVVRVHGHTATLLQDGRVLITGGTDDSLAANPLASAELYDPKTGRFVPTGSMAYARSGHTATLLPDGRVLIVGDYGTSFGTAIAAELFDPTTGQFVQTGSPVHVRNGHTATLLQDGRVLIVGGTGTGAYNDTTPASAELYDPETDRFTLTGSMAARRWSGHTATLLKDGRVLVDGGNASNVQEVPLASAELYDPKTGKFSKTGSMAVARDTQGAIPLLDGRVLVVGGDGRTAELYDPNTGKFSKTGSTIVARGGQTATLLLDGRVLIAGGWDGVEQMGSGSAELYQP
jgi:WD40 repeat protein